MKKALVSLLSLPLVFGISLISMMYGWGVSPQSIGTIAGCFVAMFLVQTLIVVVSE